MNCDECLGLHDLALDAASGKGRIDPAAHEAYRLHAAECPRCREALAADAALEATLRDLPLVGPPAAPSLPLAPARPSIWCVARLASVAAAAAIAMTAGLLSLLSPRMPPPSGVEVESTAGWVALAGGLPDLPARMRAGAAGGAAYLGGDVWLSLSPGARVQIVSLHRLRLEEGRLTAQVRRGTAFDVDTPYAQVSVTGTRFTITLRSAVPGAPPAARRSPNEGTWTPKDTQESLMSTSKTVAIAALVSVVVSAGTVTVHNALGTVEVGPGDRAVAAAGEAPVLARLADSVDAVESRVAATLAEVESLREGLSGAREAAEKRLTSLEERAASAPPVEASAASADAAPGPEAILDEAVETFAAVAKQGYLSALSSPKIAKLAEALVKLGDDGREFLSQELQSTERDRRFLAAALAERLKAPEMVKDLERSAREDTDFLVRRMSSHALAFLGDASAGDALLGIVENESRDSGVRLNAWYGLATLGRAEAVRTFDRVLAECGGDIHPDLVVDTALKAGGEGLHPALRIACRSSAVSSSMKARVLRTLASSGSPEDNAFVRELAEDSGADEALRTAAREALGNN